MSQVMNIAPRAQIVVNCLHDTNGILSDHLLLNRDNAQKQYLAPYGTTSDAANRSIIAGEIMFEVKAYNQGSQQPKTRSCLTGLLITNHFKNDAERTKYEIWKRLRVVGIAKKTALFNKSGAVEDPVAVVAGLITILNTGKASVRRGDWIMASLPDLKSSRAKPTLDPIPVHPRMLRDIVKDMEEVHEVLDNELTKEYFRTNFILFGLFFSSLLGDDAIANALTDPVAVASAHAYVRDITKLETHGRQHHVTRMVEAEPGQPKLVEVAQYASTTKHANEFVKTLQSNKYLRGDWAKNILPVGAMVFNQVGSKMLGVAQTDATATTNAFDIVAAPTVKSWLTMF